MEEVNDTMRPRRTDRTVNIPITFSKKSEGAVDKKTLIWVLLVSTVLFIIFLVGVLTGDGNWFYKIFMFTILNYAYLFILRFYVFNEGRISDSYEVMKKDDYKLSSNAYWNIFEVETTAPYVTHFANGLKGIFIQFDKDVVVGKEDYMEYKHFEGISNMYNVAHSLGLDIIDIDYMDSVGNDERMASVHGVATKSNNPELKAILTSIFSNLDKEMALDYTSYDVYLFTTRGRKEDLWYNVRQVIEYGLQANYKSYTPITPDNLRKITKSLMNLENFSMLNAEKEVISQTLNETVRPIRVVRSDGTVQLINKTRNDMQAEKAERVKKAKEKTVDKNKNEVAKSEELTDLFDDASELDTKWAKSFEDQNTTSNSKEDASKTFDVDIFEKED